MSSVLYYSKYCENCKKLLYELGKTAVQKNVHFLSIDKRINRGENTYIKLDNGHEIFKGIVTEVILDENNQLIPNSTAAEGVRGDQAGGGGAVPNPPPDTWLMPPVWFFLNRHRLAPIATSAWEMINRFESLTTLVVVHWLMKKGVPLITSARMAHRLQFDK